MLRPLAAALSLGLALPAFATDVTDMTEAERAAFGDAVRSYLLENPQVLMEAIAVLEQQDQQAQAASDADLIAANADALFSADDWVGGNPEGDVTIVEFLDYRCGYCRRAFPEVTELVKSDGNIRLIVKEYPILGDQSVMASRFALAARRVGGDDAYKAAHEGLMTMRAEVNADSLAQLAEDAGLDYAAIEAEMDGPEVEARIAETLALGQAMGVSGTPSFVFGDQMVRGYVPLDAMREIVSEERG